MKWLLGHPLYICINLYAYVQFQIVQAYRISNSFKWIFFWIKNKRKIVSLIIFCSVSYKTEIRLFVWIYFFHLNYYAPNNRNYSSFFSLQLAIKCSLKPRIFSIVLFSNFLFVSSQNIFPFPSSHRRFEISNNLFDIVYLSPIR